MTRDAFRHMLHRWFPVPRYFSKNRTYRAYEITTLLMTSTSVYFDQLNRRTISKILRCQLPSIISVCICLYTLDQRNETQTALYSALRRYYRDIEEETCNCVIGFISCNDTPTNIANYITRIVGEPGDAEDMTYEDITVKYLRFGQITKRNRNALRKFWRASYVAYTGDCTDILGNMSIRKKTIIHRLAKYLPLWSLRKVVHQHPEMKQYFLNYYRKKGYLHRYISVSQMWYSCHNRIHMIYSKWNIS